MKSYFTIFSSLLMLMIPTLLFAQIINKNSSWTEITTNLMDESYCYIRNYQLAGDTVINELQYTKIYLNNELYAALRETEDNKVYAYFYAIKAERLVYDFGWEEGKAVCWEAYDYDERGEEDRCFEIKQISTVRLLDGNYYNSLPYWEGGIIQGIGSLRGFFDPIFPVKPSNGDQYRLLCFSKNGELVYKDETFENCNSCSKKTTRINNVQNAEIIRITNIHGGVFFNVSAKNDNPQQLCLYDVAGKKIGSYSLFNQKQITILGLCTGCYFYQLIGKNNRYAGKFIITK